MIGMFTLTAVPNVCITYIVDSYRHLTEEAMTALTASRNLFAFGFSFAVIPWTQRIGIKAVRAEMCHDILILGIWCHDRGRVCYFLYDYLALHVW